MKMKRIVSIFLLLSIFCSFCLTSCSLIDTVKGYFDKDSGNTEENNGDGNNENENDNGNGGNNNIGDTDDEDDGSGGIVNPPIPEGEGINVTEAGYSFYCASEDERVRDSFSNLLYRVAVATGKSPVATTNENEAKIIFSVEDYTSEGANSAIGRYEFAFKEGKLYLSAGDIESLNFVKDRFLSYLTDDGIVLPKNLSEINLFNIHDYRVGKTTVYTAKDLANLTLLSDISIGDSTLMGFSPAKTSYGIKHEGIDYPTVTAVAINKNATVSVEQANDENGGSCRITVTANGFKRNYNINFYDEAAWVTSNIVVKGGAKGTICFVIDDGTESTATFMVENIFGKEGYENIVASFALITKKIANVHTGVNEDGEPIYVIDENGKYQYTEIEGKFDFWRNVLATGKAYLLSHTHTHTYEGDNDSGGVFRYKKNDGTYTNTAYLPIGNVTMELVASNQIVKDLSGEDDSIALVGPGVGAPHSGYYNSLILNVGEYILVRGTAGAGSIIADYNTVVILPEELVGGDLRSVRSYMIEHYMTDPNGTTDASSSNEDCLNAGIQNWTDFMDTAIATGGWASFCLHEIRPDNYKGGDHHIYESQAKALFAYANAYGDDAWIAGYNEAAKYYLEWSRSTVTSEIFDNSKIAVELVTELTDPRYDMALTVKVEIPDSWAGATIDGVELEILEDEGGKYVYVDMLPGTSVEIEVNGYDASADSGALLVG